MSYCPPVRRWRKADFARVYLEGLAQRQDAWGREALRSQGGLGRCAK